jgi:hypothetical protein
VIKAIVHQGQSRSTALSLKLTGDEDTLDSCLEKHH